jgi:5-methyltetrahydrofolate--homocysteine methyltransferase
MLPMERLNDAVLAGDRDAVQTLVPDALAAGADPLDVLNTGLLPAMDIVGQRFGAKTMYIGEVLLAARAMQTGLRILRPLLASVTDASGSRPVVVLGTVQGDLHDIGKNLVGIMLEAGGFTIVDLGTNVSAGKFIQAVNEHRPSIVALSALLTTTMRQMRQTIAELRQAGVGHGVKIIVGGAPVTKEFAETIGADGYAPDGPTAVATVRRLLHRDRGNRPS